MTFLESSKRARASSSLDCLAFCTNPFWWELKGAVVYGIIPDLDFHSPNIFNILGVPSLFPVIIFFSLIAFREVWIIRLVFSKIRICIREIVSKLYDSKYQQLLQNIYFLLKKLKIDMQYQCWKPRVFWGVIWWFFLWRCMFHVNFSTHFAFG